MCGVVGIAGKSPVNQMLFDALTMLQHRGQDAAGIVTCHNGRLFLRKDNGMVRDVFHTRHMRALLGNYGIGHPYRVILGLDKYVIQRLAHQVVLRHNHFM